MELFVHSDSVGELYRWERAEMRKNGVGDIRNVSLLSVQELVVLAKIPRRNPA